MQASHFRGCLLGELRKETREGRLADHRFNAQYLGQGRIALQPGHTRELVRSAKDPAHVTKGGVVGGVGIRAGGSVGQNLLQLGPELLLLEKVTPNHHAPMRRQALVGK